MKIYINNFNIYTWAKEMADVLNKQGHQVIFIDNNSDYQPLLDFYNKGKYEVHFLKENLGNRAPWLSGLIDNSNYYVVTDPDLDISNIPYNWDIKCVQGIKRHDVVKCGFSLDETRVPSSNPAWTMDDFCNHPEGLPHIWGNKTPYGYLDYPIDTTFAVYKPGSTECPIGGIRCPRPYTARHLPWHLVMDVNPNEDTLQIPFDFEMYNYFSKAQASSSCTQHRMHNFLKQYRERNNY